jgi:polyvinyl alcohol dehydrogenase (cytochrome)
VITRSTRSLGLLGSALTLSAIVLSAAIGTAEGPGETAEGRGFSPVQPVQAPDGARIYKERCATCHDAPDTTRSPGLEQLRVRSAAQIIASLDPGGVMAAQGQPLSTTDKQAVAAFLSAATGTTGATAATGTAGVRMSPAAPLGAAAVDPSVGACAPSMINSSLPSLTSQPMWNGWGNDLANTRFQPTNAAGLTVSDVPKLTLKWAFGFAGTSASSGQPTIAGGRVFVGNPNGFVYSLDANTGCTYWSFKADGGVRTAVSVAAIEGGKHVAMFGDIRANVYGLDAQTGAQIWKVKADDHQFARITGAPTYANGRLYVPVSSIEEVAGARPNYPCCTFRGSVIALDAATGKQFWKSYMIPEPPKVVGKNSAGTDQWRSAGVAVWTSPTIDVDKNMIYVATGNAYTSPAAPTSDAVVALSMTDGSIQWTQQVTPGDVYVIGCKPGVENCPDDVGPDFDFGNSPILRTLPGGRRIITLGQKSGVVYGIDPDNKGKLLWQVRVGKGGELGGVEWGSAADEQNIYVPVSDVLRPPAEAGGLHAVRLATGEIAWSAPAPALTCKGGPGCTGAQSAPVSVIPGAVFSGSVDGHIRAYSTTDGKIIWDFDTLREFQTVNGVKAQGGSLDAAGPVIAGGLLLTNSGYGQWRGKPGNVLLAFGVK